MAGADEVEEEKPIGELVSRLIDEGKAYGRAELGLVRAHAEVAVDRVKRPAISLGVAVAFAIAGVIALIMTLVFALASLLGPLAGGLLATLAAFAISGLFAWIAQRQWTAKP